MKSASKKNRFGKKSLQADRTVQMFFDGHYPTLPSYWIRGKLEPRHVPMYSAVYIIVGTGGVVKYVGQTTCLRQRYKDHNGSMRKLEDAIGWIPCAANELLYLESWFIATLRPWMNLIQNVGGDRSMHGKSAVLNIEAEFLWKSGRPASINRSGFARRGVIQLVEKRRVKLDDNWFPRYWVTISLP